MNEVIVDDAVLATELLYTTVFSQVFSPCGKYLAACSNFGRISIFGIATALSADSDAKAWKPICSFKAHGGPVYSLISYDRFLISAGTGSIHAWTWTEVLSKAPKISWSLNIPANAQGDKLPLSHPETNSIVTSGSTSAGDTTLYAGCGDNLVHSWDIDSGTFLRSYAGHTDYVHALAMRGGGASGGGQQFLSASEDGSVRLWDARSQGAAVQVIEPHKTAACARPKLGKWIGCVAVDKADDWMVCGGGPALSLWHIRSAVATTVFPTSNVTVNHAMFHEDSIITGGSEAYVDHWSLNGERRAHVPCSATNVFSVAVNRRSENLGVLTIAGNCHKVDVCTNFGYRAFSLLFR